jgi:hypothetical protein
MSNIFDELSDKEKNITMNTVIDLKFVKLMKAKNNLHKIQGIYNDLIDSFDSLSECLEEQWLQYKKTQKDYNALQIDIFNVKSQLLQATEELKLALSEHDKFQKQTSIV